MFSTVGRTALLAFWCAAGFSLIISGCDGNGGSSGHREPPLQRAIVEKNGTRIQFPIDNPGLRQIHTLAAEKRTATIPVISPARVVASIAAGLASDGPLILFDSPEVTSLYSAYRQSRANAERTSKNLQRVKDMLQNQAATAKDLNDAETDAATARATKSETESKLRALGFNPLDLEKVRSGTAWLISDVPESQLHEVQKGEEVDIVFSSYPDTKIIGHAEAIGEVVDPVTRTVKVRVSTANPRGKFLPGMFASVDFGDPIDGVFILPNAAVVTVEGSDYVFVQVDKGVFERRQITLGTSGKSEVVVLKGLEHGSDVVVEGAMLLKGLSFGY
jgi:membrane fusion protein, heavy metal efflux system